jgi:hypothetical protein
MKRIIFFLLLLFCIPFSIIAINGDGSFALPYNGPLTENMTWSGTVYVNGDVTVNGFTLTLNPGTTIRFLTAGSDIIVTGTGILTASGSSGSMIRFTADFNNNGIYGETGERWGHISFQNMTPGFTTPSIINYCIVEFGQKNSTPPDNDAYGGGINTSFSYLTISNCIIRNNYAGFGGGIYVSSGATTSITNCLIVSNTAGTTGGGIILYQSPNTSIKNCIIMKNTCQGAGGGGGIFIGTGSTGVTVTNSTFASNISSVNKGNNIRFYANGSTPKVMFYNTIVWGSNGSIDYYAQAPALTDFNFCAIQGYTTGYTSCINLSGTNGDPAGPNFYNVTPGSEDYRINFISPCRDAGTTPSPAIPTDYSGNSRIGAYDIGAYEVQYSRWTGTTSTAWGTAGNWVNNLTPVSGSSDVFIPKTGVTTFPVDGSNPSFTIGSGKYLVIDSGAHLTLSTLTNTAGTLRVFYNLSNLASLDIDGYTDNSGTEELSLYLKGNTAGTMWHYISPPVSSLAATTFSSAGAAVTEYRESLIDDNLNNGWVTSTGYHYDVTLPTPAWVNEGWTWPSLLVGSGYNYYANSSKTFNISGAINTGNASISLVFSSGPAADNPAAQGYNLIGNPYTCGLDWDAVVNSDLNTLEPGWADVEEAIYFKRNGVTYYYVGGSTSPNNLVGNPIAPMQGFFIHTKTNFTLTIPAAAAKVHTLNPRFKGSEIIIPSIRLQLENSGKTDETLIKFNEKATTSFDKSFDARKFTTESGVLSLSSTLEGTEYAINGLSFPESSVSIPLKLYANTAGSYTLRAIEITGVENYKVNLIDKLQNITIDLSEITSYSFDAIKGISADRFEITISNVLTAIPDNKDANKPFNIFSSGDHINIQTLSDEWIGKSGEVRVIDLTGKPVSHLRNFEFSLDEIKKVSANGKSGIYLVEIISGYKRYVGKVIIR